MKPAQPKPALSNRPDWALIVIFGVMLLLPVLDLAFHIDLTSARSENRRLATCPAFPRSLSAAQQFFSGWEKYFNDHFGCRRCLIMWHNKLKWSMFQDQTTKNVLIGTAGWLFTSNDQMIEHYCGELRFTEADLAAWRGLLEHRRNWLARHGIKYIFVIAPGKQSIYREYLPAWLVPLGRQTKVDQFVDYMHTYSSVPVLDLRPALLEAKKILPVFQKTDTHWNQFGAFAACNELVRALTNQLPELKPLSLDAFTITQRLTTGGDLVNVRGLDIHMAESNAFFFTPKSCLPTMQVFEPVGEHLTEMAFSKRANTPGLAEVYHDSFGHFWVPWLGYQFGTVEYHWQNTLDARHWQESPPLIVINEMVENFFETKDPKKLGAEDYLP